MWGLEGIGIFVLQRTKTSEIFFSLLVTNKQAGKFKTHVTLVYSNRAFPRFGDSHISGLHPQDLERNLA